MIWVKVSLYFNNSEDYLKDAQCKNTCFVGIDLNVGIFLVQRFTITRLSTITTTKKRQKCCVRKSDNATSTMQGVDESTWWIYWTHPKNAGES